MASQRRRRTGGADSTTVEMAIHEVRRGARTPEGFEPVTLETDRGDIETRYYALPDAGGPATAAAVFVGGAGGGFDTPVRGWLYPRLCDELRGDGIAGLRVRYRNPNDLVESAVDVLAGVSFLESEGVTSVALVGHSFGGAVVIQAAAAAPVVKTCIPMSTQTYGVDPAPGLSPRCSILLAHGTADEILPHRCSQYVYEIAGPPKRLLLKDGARHGLDEWSDELPGLLRWWIRTELTRRPDEPSAADRPLPGAETV